MSPSMMDAAARFASDGRLARCLADAAFTGAHGDDVADAGIGARPPPAPRPTAPWRSFDLDGRHAGDAADGRPPGREATPSPAAGVVSST
jgi:hypothetical protein